ncbi:MAG: hypothetical protein QM640_15795 [Niabella sp.]
MIPQTFEQWISCIVEDCGINLTRDFAACRLVVYKNPAHPETQKFARLYGERHLQNIVLWLEKVLNADKKQHV